MYDSSLLGENIRKYRRIAGLTQSELAEKLFLTAQNISKWETGKSLPDSSLMLSLCDILGITVNDLLSGEVVTMENYNKEMENKLIEMVKEKEESDKRLLKFEVVIGVLSCLVLFIPIFIGARVPMQTWARIVVICSGVIPAAIGFAFALKIEQIAGYYECKNCGKKYVPTFKAVNLAPHLGRTRQMRCPHCQKISWHKKVLSKD